MGVLGERVGIDPKYADEVAVAQALRAQRVLVHVDNVDSAESAELVAALSRALGGVPLLVTGRYAELGTAGGSGWTRRRSKPSPGAFSTITGSRRHRQLRRGAVRGHAGRSRHWERRQLRRATSARFDKPASSSGRAHSARVS
jgi:hypothetical protein